ncbi:MAG: stage 0 sporulation protein [bacterium]|nr:MAG: stage 0 sporulation protein [bacterium]
MDESIDGKENTVSGVKEGAVRTVRIYLRGKNRESHCHAGEHSLKPGDQVVVETDQGKALGVVTSSPVEFACRGCERSHVLRKATPDEIQRDDENRSLEERAFVSCRRIIDEWELPMRLIKVEYLFDRSKAIFYFTAEKRVDFRELVRTLAKDLQLRIEMRQIGIRDEAKLTGGIGPCGMPFCCCTFLKDFAPISVKMAKEQNVILNPNKISGGCGRLLCCLSYEYDQYREMIQGLPKVGKKVNLPEGSGKIRAIDFFARTITIDLSEGESVVIGLDEFREKVK